MQLIRANHTLPQLTGEELTLLLNLLLNTGYVADTISMILDGAKQGALEFTKEEIEKLQQLLDKLRKADF